MPKLLLIDGNSIMNRGYFALPKELTTRNGIHTNAILGFLNIFYKVYEEEKPTHIAVAFDVHEPTFRHKMYEQYKGTRHGMDEELREQLPLIKEILSLMGISYWEKGGYEADDIIGTLSREAIRDGLEVSILSGDRDLLQLATDTVLVRIPKTKAGKTTVENYYADDVVKEYGVTPVEFIEMKGLMGDTSDNIPGVQGIGPKTASNIIQKYHSIEEALKHIEEIKPDKARKNLDEQRETALFSRDLATIKLDCELDGSVTDTEIDNSNIYGEKVYSRLQELELKSLLKRFDNTEVAAVAETPVLDIVEKSYSEIIEIINNNDEEQIGLSPFIVDGMLAGGCVATSDSIYLTRDSALSDIKKDIKESCTIDIISIKELIDFFMFEEKDKLFDLSIAAYLLDPLKNSFPYDYIAEKYLEVSFPEEKELLGKKEITVFSIDDEDVRKVLAYKAYTSLHAAKPLIEKLAEAGEEELYRNIEYPTLFVLRSMERIGVKVNKNTLIDYGNDLDIRINKLTADIYNQAGEEFNINSTKQLGVILFEKMGLTGSKKTKSGYSTSADVLNKIKDQHEIIPNILEYRQLTKLKSTYVEGLIHTIAPDGRIHSTFNQTVTATGRISSTEPNLQNLPTRTALGREIRKAFVPEEGFTFVDADYSQIELRVMAAISKDEALINAFNEAKDIHAITASQVFDVPLENVTSDLRRKAKAVNFGIIYGISSFGLGEDLGISRKEASGYIEKYFQTYSRVKQYLDEKVEEAKKEGYVKTLYGRIRPIPELKSSNFMQRSFGERVAMNSPIQGTAADIIKIAMINVYKELKEKNYKSRLILQIHDELLIEASLDEEETVKELIERCMTEAADLAVGLFVDVHSGSSMYEAK
ncbi:MAG TPA: DNA polymerase I [Lachnospiraceae bacterium]|nr:DNA polymerase I [Lachnospiraceae bacterium]